MDVDNLEFAIAPEALYEKSWTGQVLFSGTAHWYNQVLASQKTDLSAQTMLFCEKQYLY